MQQEDTRDWLYHYRVSYSIGYQCTIGFGNKDIEDKFYRLVREARDKFRPVYAQPFPQVIMLSATEGIYFDGWEAEVRFKEWGPNRTYKNFPMAIQEINKIIEYVVDGMGGSISSRQLYEVALDWVNASDRLTMPLAKQHN